MTSRETQGACTPVPEASAVTSLLALAPFYVWAYNGPMELVTDPGSSQIAARGPCPHCATVSYFRPVTGPHSQTYPGRAEQDVVNAAQCEACKQFVLIVGRRHSSGQSLRLHAFFPLGKPNDSVDESVPPEVSADFKEALRCHWVEAYKASVVMCRRALQSSVLALGAKDEKLVEQIDFLFAKGKITEPLKDFAHEVRLTGNDGAHPDKDGLVSVTEKDALDMIEFTREYLHHVYVMPAKLKARQTPAAVSRTAS